MAVSPSHSSLTLRQAPEPAASLDSLGQTLL